MVNSSRHHRRRSGSPLLIMNLLFSVMLLFGCGIHQKSDRRFERKAETPGTSINAVEQSRSDQDSGRKKASAAYHFGLACLYWEAQDIERALTHFNQACESDPDSAYINFTIGTFFRNLAVYENDLEMRYGALRRAEYYFENAYVVDPQDSEILTALADVSSQLGKSSTAITLFQQALKLQPDNIEVRFSLATELTLLRQYRDSIEVTNEILMKEPENPRAHIIMGYNYFHLQQDEIAMTHFEQAYRTNAYDSSLVMHLGTLYEKNHEYEKAVEIYRRICQISPKDSPFYKNYVRSLLVLSKFELAEKVIQEILAADIEDFLWHFYLGLILVERENYAAAIPQFQRARELNTEDPRPVYELSLCYSHLGDHEKALSIIKEAIVAQPRDPLFYGYLGNAYIRLNNFEKAIESFHQGLTLDPADRNLLIQLAGALERTQRIEETEHVLLRLIEIDPQSSEALNFLGYLYAEQNVKLDQAEKYLERALAIEPNNSAYIDSMGWIYYRQKRYEHAHDWLLRASTAMQHNDPVVLSHLADTLIQLECYSLAIKALERARTFSPDNEEFTKKIIDISGKEDADNVRCSDSLDFLSVSDQAASPLPSDMEE